MLPSSLIHSQPLILQFAPCVHLLSRSPISVLQPFFMFLSIIFFLFIFHPRLYFSHPLWFFHDFCNYISLCPSHSVFVLSHFPSFLFIICLGFLHCNSPLAVAFSQGLCFPFCLFQMSVPLFCGDMSLMCLTWLYFRPALLFYLRVSIYVVFITVTHLIGIHMASVMPYAVQCPITIRAWCKLKDPTSGIKGGMG